MSSLKLHLELPLFSIDSITTASPITPCNTPTPKGDHINNLDYNVVVSPTPKYSMERTMKNAGYSIIDKIDETLQGSVWKVSSGSDIRIIKVTDKALHKQQVTYITGKAVAISEDIVKEQTILKYLSECDHKAPSSLVQFIEFFSDKYNYFLVMEYGGPLSLFEFVQTCHQLIAQGTLSIKEWQLFCKRAFKQMVHLLDWLHNKMHCCHLDISLENFVIDDIEITVSQKQKKEEIVFDPNFEIKLIDFGVAEVFHERNEQNEIVFQCSQYVGKQSYQAPEICNRAKSFDARAADCWSLAVVFLMMISGCTPFRKPSKKDAAYKAIMSGNLTELLFSWQRLNYVTPQMLHLLHCMFQIERYRVSINDIKLHPFLL